MNDPLAPPRAPFKYAWIWILGVIILALLAKPTFGLVKIWRSKLFLSDAKKAFAQGKLNEAQDKSFLCHIMIPKIGTGQPGISDQL